MATDASIYAQAGKPTVALQDPNTVMQAAATTSNAVLQNRLLQAGQARGQLMQQAIDPTTGQFDPAQFNRLLGQSPAAAMAAPEAVAQSQALAGQQQDLATRQNGYLNSVLGAALKVPDAQLHDVSASAINGAVKQGLIKPEDGTRIAMGLSTDPAQLRQQLTQMQMRAMPAGAQRDATYGTASGLNTGGTYQAGTVAPVDQGGGFRPSTSTALSPGPQFVNNGSAQISTSGGIPTGDAPIQTTLSPSERATPTQIGTTPQGTPIMGTRDQFLQRAAGGTSPFGTGRLPGALLNPNRAPAPSSAPTTTAAPTSGGAGMAPPPVAQGIVQGVGPAQQAAMSADGAASAKAFQDIQDQSVQARSQGATLGNMLGDTTQFTSGQTGVNNFKATMQRQAPAIASIFGLDPNKVAANESFDKLANQIAGAQGAGSDARLAVTQHANPNSAMSAAGVDQVLRQLQGNADYTQARAKLAALHPDKSDRAGFESGAGAMLDPRAFQFDRMTPPQRASYAASLSPQDRAQVQAAYNYAHGQNLLAPTAQPTPAASAPPAAPAPRLVIPGY